ncbi:MAG TPA: hybrid sensor histidine kinase/response regulator [Myxococcaceae bacterium]|nr:hybrid sensor histidine kinase/response regulator [Myxococcaceae bacterium]
MTVVHRNETAPQAPEMTGVPPGQTTVHGNEPVIPVPETTMATVLAELLRTFGRAESTAELVTGVCEVLARDLSLEGVLLQVRDREGLRAAAGVGLGVEAEALPVVDGEIHPWPAAPGPFVLEAQAVARLLQAVPVRWRVVHAVPLGDPPAPVGALYLATRAGRTLGAAEEELLRTLGEALGPELGRRLEHDRIHASLRAREDALAVVAHDLRNPLHAVTVGVGTLLPRITEPALRRPVERIQRSAQRMERLLQDLLDIHAIEGGRFTVSKGEVAPTALILTALESQQSVAGQTSVIINTDVAPSLPSVGADEERVLQVLENLVGNALKFTPPGGVVTVGATRGTDPGCVLFSVRDTGPGISSDHLPRVFDRYFQAHSSDHRGAGLGLAICKAIVEAHGGRIWAESEPGKGATFFFTLAAATGDLEKVPQAVSPAPLLLVDDKAENLTALAAILDRPDYRLVCATSGEEALRLALRERFAAALIDVAMPRMNGFEVATNLKALERSRHIPIIFITAFGEDPEEIHRAYAAGGADYLVKPLDPEIVRKKVAVFVELSRKRQDSEPSAHSSS